jgi:tetratricopeptide (TPR) repeat protein
MMLDPNNRKVTLAYVEAARAAGDLEGAIGALSRFLLTNSENPEIHMQLAELYRSLKSYEMAKIHYQKALALELAPVQREGAERALEELAAEGAQGESLMPTVSQRISGELQIGASFQSDATVGPRIAARYFGQDVTPQGKFAAHSDANSFLYASINHTINLGDDNAQRWDTNLTLYATQERRVAYENVSYGRITSGPTWVLGESGASTVHPYVIAEVFGLGDALLASSGGAGLAWDTPVVDDLRGRLEFETIGRAYNSSGNYTYASTQDAYVTSARYLLSYSWNDDNRLSFQFQATDDIARVGYGRYWEWRLSPVIEHRFESLWGGDPWVVTASAQWTDRPYGGADSNVDRDLTRHDVEYGGTLQMLVPIEGAWSARAGFNYTRANSSIANYRYVNIVPSASVQLAF